MCVPLSDHAKGTWFSVEFTMNLFLFCQTHPVWVVQSACAFHVSTWSILFSLVIGVADQVGNGRVPV